MMNQYNNIKELVPLENELQDNVIQIDSQNTP